METKELKKVEPTDSALVILNNAISTPDMDIDKLEKFIELYERLENRKKEQLYYEAFPQLQSELPLISRDGKIMVNNIIRSNYAKFETIMKVIQPSLTKYGFGVSFIPRCEKDKIIVSCKVSHSGGHIEKADIELPHDSSGSKNSVQAIGSSMTYAKRYALCLILNIATEDEDNDGNKEKVKPQMTEDQFKKTMARVEAKKTTLKIIEANLSMTEEQREAIVNALGEKL